MPPGEQETEHTCVLYRHHQENEMLQCVPFVSCSWRAAWDKKGEVSSR